MSPPGELGTAREQLLTQFLADIGSTLTELDTELGHGNVLAARATVLSMKVQLSMFTKALQR